MKPKISYITSICSGALVMPPLAVAIAPRAATVGSTFVNGTLCARARMVVAAAHSLRGLVSTWKWSWINQSKKTYFE